MKEFNDQHSPLVSKESALLFILVLSIVYRGKYMCSYEARQTSKEQTRCQQLGWKVHERAQSFVLRLYTMHELRNQNVSICQFLNTE